MAEQRIKTNLQGVYKRVSGTRRNHLDGKADICFDITYKVDGKKVWEKVGWKSEGYTAQFAHGLRAERLQSVRHGEPVNDKERQHQGLTFGAAWDIYREKWLPNIATPDHEHRRYEKHIAPHLADKLLSDIKPLDLESFKQRLGGNGLSP
ncbi:MAG: hypothetical protein LBT47_00550 [Deltaproteobacteria bacterium]|jgi:hypothetical protein|nr:hypothetical protein [Deltaproteobacteria bacterium]